MSFDKMFMYLQTDIHTTYNNDYPQITINQNINTCTDNTIAEFTSGKENSEINENDIWPQVDLELGENSCSDDSLDTSTESSNSTCGSLSNSLDEETINLFSLLCIANDKNKKITNNLRKYILNKQCLNNIISYVESNIYV